MELAAEDRVNMSLEELVKLKNAAKKAAKKTQNKPAGGAKNSQKKGKKGGNGNGNGEINSAAKVAKVVGTGKAKRDALQAQKRGLNATGKATKMDIEKAVNKQANKTKTPLLKKGANGKGKQAGTGLKISFKTADLAKTTDKIVAAQVKGALSKQGNIGANFAKPSAPAQQQQKPQARTVSVPKNQQKAKPAGGGNGRRRK